jgi:hypothetical protein
MASLAAPWKSSVLVYLTVELQVEFRELIEEFTPDQKFHVSTAKFHRESNDRFNVTIAFPCRAAGHSDLAAPDTGD